jgi:lipooligosaccharide transport system permease protein
VSARSDVAALADWRSYSVLRRNALVYFRNWKTAFFPPAMEPVIFFLAFGLGLGGYVGSLMYDDRSVPYATWVAPGLVAYTSFSTPFFEALYSSYVRMFYQKTWDGILATQVELRHIVWGEILWAGVRGMMNAALVAVVLAGFHAAGIVDIRWWFLPMLPLIGCVAGWTFGAFGLIFTALVPAIDHMNYPVFLIGIPLGLVSNTYFPVESDIVALQAIVQLNPVYHLSETCRALLVGGDVAPHALGLALTSGVLLLVCSVLAQRLMRKRLLGD